MYHSGGGSASGQERRTLYKSPTYRSSVNLNHEETSKLNAAAAASVVVRESKYKPKDKMALILS